MSSNNTKYYIAVDLAPFAGKVNLASVIDGKVSMETVHQFAIKVTRMAGKSFWNINYIYDEILKGLNMVGARKLQIESIGIDGWGSDFVCVAKDGTFIGLPRSSSVPYTAATNQKFFRKMDRRELYGTTGVQISDAATPLQLFAQHKSKGLALSDAKTILFIPDAIIYMLTGKKVCEYTLLASSGLMNINESKIDKDVLSVCHVKSRRFPSVVKPGEKVARLTEEVGVATGLGRVQVTAVAGLSAASAVAALPADGEGFAYLVCGPRAVMGIEAAATVIGDQTFDYNISNEAGVGGTYRLQKETVGTGVAEACLAKWRSEGRAYSFEQVQSLVSQAVPAVAQLDFDDAVFAEATTDMPSVIAKYCSSNSMAVPKDDAAVLRLVYESAAHKYGELFRRLQGLTTNRLRTVFVTGPGAQNPVLNQMIAYECCVPVTVVPSDGAALGNIIVQAGLTRKNVPKSDNIIEPNT